jgi:hypothetical protein
MVEPSGKVITLCGSTRFKEAHELAMMHLTLMGNIVIPCGFYGHVDEPMGAQFLCDDGDEDKQAKKDVDNLHLQKIDMSDAIYIVNVGGYIGNSTRREISHAVLSSKEILWMFTDAIPAEYIEAVGMFD